MSEPVTNVEIEDVLSSIRRLVSDEARTPIRAREHVAFRSDVPPQPVEIEEELGVSEPFERPRPPAPALVLTPALRVETANDDAPVEAISEQGDEVAELQEGASTLILSPQAHTQEIAAQDESESAAHAEPEENTEHVDAEFEQADTLRDADSEQSTAEHSEHSEHREPDEPADSAEDMTAPTQEEHSFKEHSFEEASNDEDVQEAHIEAQSDDVGGNEPEAEVAQEGEPKSIEAKIAALESLINRSETEFEPDGAEDGGNAARSGNALPWEDSDEPRAAQSQPEVVLPDPDDASQSASFSEEAIAFQRAHAEAVNTAQEELDGNVADTLLETEDMSAVLDEDALRDMVSEIVRQELQGPLGERITRNVRKLVRREIYRALAANELD